MTAHAHPVGDFRPVTHRPGMRTRHLIATEHGFTTLFVVELLMDDGASVPLHSHSVDEAVVVTEGELTIQVGDETIVAQAESVVRIPPDVPHAICNRGPEQARALAAAAWNRVTFFEEATRYLEGKPRVD